eukprot:CAMPEP_0179906738 /NCGR_PEP_ID=MMETSP0982-20121206/43417_1 /TAXON_ID=483367 /ORGANISM="non described non described, Strain CCMP 2436" /LENGTH=114 /DNA_ID=CAMNT_0021807291 /DNA_START=715 /DNA_END=1060 /DNA_ORIENTATION=-
MGSFGPPVKGPPFEEGHPSLRDGCPRAAAWPVYPHAVLTLALVLAAVCGRQHVFPQAHGAPQRLHPSEKREGLAQGRAQQQFGDDSEKLGGLARAVFLCDSAELQAPALARTVR